MLLFSFLVTFAVILSKGAGVAANQCWRDTDCTGPTTQAFPGSWDQYNYSPSSRYVQPASIITPGSNSVQTYAPNAALNGNGSQLIFDFGKEVGGIVTVTYSAKGSGQLGLAFTEAKIWTGEWSDDSNGSFNPDGALYANITTTAEGNWTMPDAKLRGGFRYLTLFTTSTATVSVNIIDIELEIAYQPAWSNLRAYQGYFSCSDDLLNKIWYAGAYTLQTNAIPGTTGRAFPILGSGWMNDMNLELGDAGPTVYVDGSKRDRTVWPGDLGIAVPSILVSTGDWEGIRNTLQVLYNDQSGEGELPFAGPAINIYGSDTYHMATLMGTYDYFLWTNDKSWLSYIYPSFQNGMTFITQKIDSTGMLNVTGEQDWGRLKQGGHNTEANMLLYKILVGGSQLADWSGDSASSSTWSSQAQTLKAAVNKANWDAGTGAYKDSDIDGSIHPQDGNSMALLFNVSDPTYIQNISTQLTTNWISIGAVAPELPNNLVGFGQSFEIKGHLAARQATRALELIRRAWGWYLNNPMGTGSTFIEGYLADGTFGYRAANGYNYDYAYTSHAHGWSTGPTDALTSYIVGLTIIAPGGSEWQFAPQFGDLTHAEAGFTTPLGQFSASWSLVDGGYDLSWAAPGGTSGSVVLPVPPGQSSGPTVVVGGESVKGDYDPVKGTVTIQGASGSHSGKVVY